MGEEMLSGTHLLPLIITRVLLVAPSAFVSQESDGIRAIVWLEDRVGGIVMVVV